jgi:F0F1-type ATP synthase membrane subunit b/b'
MRRRLMRFGSALAAVAAGIFLTAAPALAAANPQEEADSTLGWIYRWLNFLIFFGFIVYFFYKKTPPFFRRRREAIVEAIAESARAREAAERQQREAEAKLATLDKEVAELRVRSNREIAAEIERIRALAQEEARRIEQAGKIEVLAAEHAAQTELKVMAARLAIDRAEALLRQQMTPREESAMFTGFLMDLEGGVN